MPRTNANGPSDGTVERWRVLRLGTSSSTSDDSSEWSGDSLPETAASSPLPAPSVDSPSWRDLRPSPTSSSASLTDGSTQGTGSSQPSQLTSSEESATETEAGQDSLQAAEPELVPPPESPYAGLSGGELMELARVAYNEEKYDESEALLGVALAADATLAGPAEAARGYIARARAREAPPSQPDGASAGPSEAVPADGGFLTGA